MKKKDTAGEMTFEAAIGRLEEIVSLLQDNDAPLEDSLRLFEEGAGLAEYCDSKLKKAEQSVREITEKAQPGEKNGEDAGGES